MYALTVSLKFSILRLCERLHNVLDMTMLDKSFTAMAVQARGQEWLNTFLISRVEQGTRQLGQTSIRIVVRYQLATTLLVDHVTLSALFLILGRRSFIACETWQSKKIVREACSFEWIKRCGGDLSKCTIRFLWLYYLAMEFKDARACTMPSYTYMYIAQHMHAHTRTHTHNTLH